MRRRRNPRTEPFSYASAHAVLATKHHKLTLIAPPLAERAGLVVDTVEVDTDTLGTFTGEVPRRQGPLKTAIAKARLGMRATGARLGLASEGTIAPDPSVPLIVVDHEYVVLVDEEHDLVIVGQARSDAIRMYHRVLTPRDDVAGLLEEADVPPHHLIVRPRTPQVGGITKAVADHRALREAIALASRFDPEGLVVLETDLRAHLCPSRQPTIARAAEDLGSRLATCCPRCHRPGFGMERRLGGLPCEACGAEVAVPATEEFACPSCRYHELRTSPKLTADRAQCPVCSASLG